MTRRHFPAIGPCAACFLMAISATGLLSAQQPQGPQPHAQSPVLPKPPPARAGSSERVIVPTGTRIGVVLQNGITTRSAKPGDSVYLQTSFPVTIGNRIVIPVGSYLRGELVESKRPDRKSTRLNSSHLGISYAV